MVLDFTTIVLLVKYLLYFLMLGKHFSNGSGAVSEEVALMKKIKRHENVIALIGVCFLNGLFIVAVVLNPII
jgi:hypothetical protein